MHFIITDFFLITYTTSSKSLHTKKHFPLFATVISCGNLSNPSNGIIQFSNSTAGGVATYVCDAGYDVVGDGVRECQCNRQWSGSEATCQGMCTRLNQLYRVAKVCVCAYGWLYSVHPVKKVYY